MIDFQSDFGRAVKEHLRNQYVIWLTTLDSNLTPQPRPVWFLWEDDSFRIFSQAEASRSPIFKKHPRVALHFNTDETGDRHVIVFTGEASVDMDHPPAHEVPAYLKKYGDDIAGLGMTPDQFSREYSVAIKIAPAEIRGWE